MKKLAGIAGTFVGTAAGVLVVIGLVSIVLAFPVMWCWNYAIVHIWGLPRLNCLHAWCLIFMANAVTVSVSRFRK